MTESALCKERLRMGSDLRGSGEEKLPGNADLGRDRALLLRLDHYAPEPALVGLSLIHI